MGKQWKSGCKRCGEEFGYSDRSFKNDLKIGYSRPEYCEKCQKSESETRKMTGLPYVKLKVKSENKPCKANLTHPGRNHQLIEKEGSFDESMFGITPDKIVEIANWFQNPKHRVVVVVGPTGSGKSTALPAWLMDPSNVTDLPSDYFTREGQIVHTQPRTISIDNQTKFVGDKLLGVGIGAGFDVGSNYSQHNKSDRRNLWVPVTDGTFINLIIKGKLNSYGYIIIDEAHERSINIDQILRLLKDRLSLFPKIKIIICSATINAQKFQEYFGSEIAGIIEFEGKDRRDKNGNYVDHTEFFQDETSPLVYNDLPKLGKSIVNIAVQKALWLTKEIVDGRKNKGDILVFLQGKGPIKKAVDQTRSFINNNNDLANMVEVYPLYRDLPDEEKDKINKHNLDDGKTWIIYSTNIAEASVTIDSLGYEIETGLENQSIFDSHTNTTVVQLNLISRANAQQRWGRTGRTRNGEVYCLYTENQFNNSDIFLDDPIPSIQRSSMEESVLVLKSAGVSDSSVGWLQNPDSAQTERSLSTLVKSGVINSDGSLSKRGMVLGSFSYPSKLVDALFMADDLGVIVEFTSILPVIMNGGCKKFLNWSYNWDGYIKLDAFNKHQALMSGCQDDVEFILKIVKLWVELSWVQSNSLIGKTARDKKILRQDWAKRNYLNIKEIEILVQQREEILNRFFENNKNEDFPDIDFTLTPRVRSLLLNVFPETIIKDSQTTYEFDPFLKPTENSNIVCNCLSSEIVSDSDSLSRLFIDQIYTINSRFFAIPIPDSENTLKRTSKIIHSIIHIDEEIFIEVEDEIETEEEEKKEVDKNKDTEEKILKKLFNNILINHTLVTVKIHCYQKIPKDSDDLLEFEVIGYEFINTPTVIVRPIIKPEPFDEFIRLKKVSNNIQVEVIKTLTYPHDNHPILLVKEILSQMEILMVAEEITFSNAASVITKIPIGTVLEARVVKIIPKAQRVYLSMLSQSEQTLNDLFALESNKNNRNNDPTIMVRVADIRSDGVNFVLDWAKPQNGFIPISFVHESKLPKSLGECQLEEEFFVSICRGAAMKHPIKTPLPNLPKLLKSQLNNKKVVEGLNYRQPCLEFTGRMSNNVYSNLKNINNNMEYQKAIAQLYWLSNRVNITRFLDNDWFQEVQEKFPIGTKVQAVIKEIVQQSGITLETNTQYKAFMPRSLVLGEFYRQDLSHWFSPGDMIFAQVAEIRIGSKELILEQIPTPQKISDPIFQFKPTRI